MPRHCIPCAKEYEDGVPLCSEYGQQTEPGEILATSELVDEWAGRSDDDLRDAAELLGSYAPDAEQVIRQLKN